MRMDGSSIRWDNACSWMYMGYVPITAVTNIAIHRNYPGARNYTVFVEVRTIGLNPDIHTNKGRDKPCLME